MDSDSTADPAPDPDPDLDPDHRYRPLPPIDRHSYHTPLETAAMQEATLCYVVRDGEVLMIEKRRGLGEGWYNGPGGKCEDGETPRECVIREVREEVGIDVDVGGDGLEKAGELTFVLDGTGHTRCHVFRTDTFAGEPTALPEARPVWFDVESIPYDRMWDDDDLWLPGVLEGKTVSGRFEFEGGEPLDEAEFADHDLEWGVSFD